MFDCYLINKYKNYKLLTQIVFPLLRTSTEGVRAAGRSHLKNLQEGRETSRRGLLCQEAGKTKGEDLALCVREWCARISTRVK